MERGNLNQHAAIMRCHSELILAFRPCAVVCESGNVEGREATKDNPTHGSDSKIGIASKLQRTAGGERRTRE